MIGFEPGNEQRTPQDEKRFSLPGYLGEDALDEAFASKDHTHLEHFSKLDGIEPGADKTDLEKVLGALDALTMADPVDATVVFGSGRKWTWATLKATLKSYFDGIYQKALGFNPANLAGDTFTGAVKAPQFVVDGAPGTNVLKAGTGDGASYAIYNMLLQGWFGLGLASYDGAIKGYYDFRAGKWDTKGGFFKNGVEALYSNGGTITGNLTFAGGAERQLHWGDAGIYGYGTSGGVGYWYAAANKAVWSYTKASDTFDVGAANFTQNGVAVVRNTGTWNININGTAANANQLGGRASANIWDNAVSAWKYSSEGQERFHFVNGGRTYFNSGTVEGYTATFRFGGADKLHIGGDGNLWMAWAGDWLSNILAGKITADGRAYPRGSDGRAINFNWSGQGGQPSWLWGSNDGSNYYVWNPSNFSVNYANGAGNADTVDGYHAGDLVRNDNFSAKNAAFGVDEVGCIAMLRRTTSPTIGQAETSLGSQLVYCNADGSSQAVSPNGTWRCLGRAIGAGSGGSGVTIWRRIS